MRQTSASNLLINENLDLAKIAVNTVLQRSNRKVTEDEREDLVAEATKALVEVAVRWPEYCEVNGYEAEGPKANEWFRIYATRRLKGAIIDFWRKESPLTRNELDLSTFGIKHGAEAAAKRYGVTVEAVTTAMHRRDNLIVASALPEEDDDPNVPEALAPYSLWDTLHHTISQMPLIAQVWIALVYVHHIPVKDARHLVGLKDIPRAAALEGYVEYHIVKAVLEDRVLVAA